MSQQVNLYHPVFLKREQKFSAQSIVLSGAVIVLGVLVVMGVNVWQTRALRVQVEKAEQQRTVTLRRVEDIAREFLTQGGDRRLAEEVSKLESLLKAPEKVREVLQHDTFEGTAGYSAYFVALARQSLPGMWLTGIEISGAGRELILRGRAVTPARVPQYLQRLALERSLAGLEFEVFQLSRPQVTAAGEREGGTDNKVPHTPYVEFVIRTKSEAAPAKP